MSIRGLTWCSSVATVPHQNLFSFILIKLLTILTIYSQRILSIYQDLLFIEKLVVPENGATVIWVQGQCQNFNKNKLWKNTTKSEFGQKE